MRQTSLARQGVAVLAALVLGISAACGDDGERGAATPSRTSEDGSPGGEHEPIKIGLANNEGQMSPIPSYRIATEAAVDYINENGGINGADVELVTCITDGTPESSLNCANQFIDAGAVVYLSLYDPGVDAALPVLAEAGIPNVSTQTWGAQQKTDDNSFVFGAAVGGFTAATFKTFAEDGVERVAAVFLDVPVTHDIADNVAAPLAEKFDLEFEAIFTSASTPDWASGVAAAQANGADALWSFLPEAMCTNFVRAARSGGFDGPIGAASCSQYIDELGEQALDTISVSGWWPAAIGKDGPEEIRNQVEIYTEAMTSSGNADSMDFSAENGFAAMMELAEVLRGIDGGVTAASLREALEGAHDVPGFLRGPLECRTEIWPSEPSVCRASVLVMEVVDGPDGPQRVPVGDDMLDVSDYAL